MHFTFSTILRATCLWGILIAIAFNTSGCSSVKMPKYLSALKSGEKDDDEVIRPRGDMFSRFLYEGYRRQGRKEDMQHDYDDAEYYVMKSQAAARGEHVSPQHILERDIPSFALAELSYARARLDWALTNNAPVYFAEETAEAQVMFDCWLEQQEENIQQHDIDECKTKFKRLIAYIEASFQTPSSNHVACPMAQPQPQVTQCGQVAQPMPLMPSPQPMPIAAAMPKAAPMPMSPCQKPMAFSAPLGDKEIPPPCGSNKTPQQMATMEQFNLLFILDSTELIADSRRQLQAILELTQQHNVSRITLSGHADRSGTQNHNQNLSARRVEKIKRVLAQYGVPAELLEEAHHGENMPKLQTPDGQRELMNRRVEVTVFWQGAK